MITIVKKKFLEKIRHHKIAENRGGKMVKE